MKPGIFLVACLISLNIFSQTQKLPDSLNLFFFFHFPVWHLMASLNLQEGKTKNIWK
jgi:hypothetical protein